ncbi:MAG: isochorismatase family protein [Candidatus Aminicenantes bacterium]|nr:MAG: isochorismatase family protein [Candidatus Aminicenantes bacterium]
MRKNFLLLFSVIACACLLLGAWNKTMSDRSLMIDRSSVGIILIDVQPVFVDIMSGSGEPVMERLEQLLVLADVTQIPFIATFEHPTEQNGWLPDRLEKVFPKHGERFVKRTFCLCREPEIRSKLEKLKIKQIVLAGCETDVCVLQSALGLLEMGYQVFLLEDSVFTNESYPEPAIKRMYQAGVIPSTYKTFFYEMTQSVDRKTLPAAWKEKMSSLSKVFKSPYRLVPRERKK